jgi:hypothetical protein
MTDRALVFPEIAPAQPPAKAIDTPDRAVEPDSPPSKTEAPENQQQPA